jgi:Zn-dependent protease with chaperone function
VYACGGAYPFESAQTAPAPVRREPGNDRYRTEMVREAVQDFPAMGTIVLLAVLALLSGCSTNPVTGREQILALPAVQAAYADIGFAVSTGAQSIAATPACGQDCGSAQGRAEFADRVEKIGARLDAAARDMYPELSGRIGRFQIEVNDAFGAGTGSSAGGRIVLGGGLAGLEPSDAVIAFLIAREMAHVVARHAEEDSGASLLFSALGMLLPVLNVAVRFVATTLGSGALKSSWAVQQQREADRIAVELLEHAGLPASRVAVELERGINRAGLPDDDWRARYLESVKRVARIVAGSPSAAADHP